MGTVILFTIFKSLHVKGRMKEKSSLNFWFKNTAPYSIPYTIVKLEHEFSQHSFQVPG